MQDSQTLGILLVVGAVCYAYVYQTCPGGGVGREFIVAPLIILPLVYLYCQPPTSSEGYKPRTIHLIPEASDEDDYEESYEESYEEDTVSNGPYDHPEPANYQEPTAGQQYHGGYGSTFPKTQSGVEPTNASSRGIQGAPVTAGPSCAMKHEAVGFGSEGTPSTACGIKRGGKPFYMFGVGM